MIINGNLDLMENNNLISLGNLKKVKGNINLFDCKNLKNLGELISVYGDMNLNYCKKIKHLGKLKNVQGSIFLDGSGITEEYIKKYKPQFRYKCVFKVQDLLEPEDFEI